MLGRFLGRRGCPILAAFFAARLGIFDRGKVEGNMGSPFFVETQSDWPEFWTIFIANLERKETGKGTTEVPSSPGPQNGRFCRSGVEARCWLAVVDDLGRAGRLGR